MKVVRLSALRTGRLYPPWEIPGTHFCYRPSRTQNHSATGRIKSTKNPKDPIGNQTRDLTACSAVPQSTAPPRTPYSEFLYVKERDKCSHHCVSKSYKHLTVRVEVFGLKWLNHIEAQQCHVISHSVLVVFSTQSICAFCVIQ
jgi:hypothetical protein